MKFRIRLFLWLSALLAAIGFIACAQWLPEISNNIGLHNISEMVKAGKLPGFIKMRWGLFTIGTVLLLSCTLLFLLGKKLKTSRYVIYFLLCTVVSIVLGSAVVSL